MPTPTNDIQLDITPDNHAGHVPVGGEFRVNTYTTGDQDSPTITALSDGGFVVSWMSSG